jgi:DNA-binding transcriptional ArsR family regulator
VECTIRCPPDHDKDVRITMIDRIRQDIQDRLDQLLAEADRLRQALSALGGERAGATPRATRSSSGRSSSSSSSGSGSRSRSASATRSRRADGAAPRARSGRSAEGSSRAASGGTKNAVLKALADSGGQALTASEVAAATGLGRASVSTTLSKLARAGDVHKAQRGYRLGGASAASGNGAGEAESSAS